MNEYFPKALEHHFEVLSQLDATQRIEALHDVARQQPALAHRLAALLDAHASGADALGTIEQEARLSLGLIAPEDLLGREFGGYRLTEVLGRGGMGVVFGAERTHSGVHQRVAIKLLSLPMFDAEASARFLREAGLLARLTHPGICRLRDFGRSMDGWPYLVLDRIDGEALHAGAKAKPLAQRIGLVAKVADAVAAAHRQLIVHLDIKPQNVLVNTDGNPVLLDFGIARVLDENGRTTASLARWLTPDYAAPERLRGEPSTVAADLYSLGALLYHVCCGDKPFDLVGVSVTEALKRIEQGPVPPTRRVSALPRDLDAVVAKAMHVDPMQRYVTADAFAADLRALLAAQPVSAKADSLGYRLRKLLQRHPVAVPATVLSVLAVTVLAISLALQTRELRTQRDLAEREALRARSAATLLLDSIRAADPTRERGDALTLNALLDATEQRIDANLSATPVLQSDALIEVADVRRSLGQFARAVTLYEQARALRSQRALPEDATAERAAIGLADALRGADRLTDAVETAHAALAAPGGDGHWELWLTSARAKLAVPKLDEAETEARKALALMQPPQRAERAQALYVLGSIESRRNKHIEALASFAQALELIENDPAESALKALLLGEMAFSHSQQSDYEVAMALIERALSLRIELYGEQHPRVVSGLLDKAYILDDQGQWQPALVELNRAIDIENALGDGRTRRMERLLAMAYLLHRRLGNLESAQDFAQRGLTLAEQIYPAPNASRANAHANMAAALADRKDYAGALLHNRSSWEIYNHLSDTTPLRGRAVAAINLAANYRDLGQLQESLLWSERSLSEAEQFYAADDWMLGNFRIIQAKTLFLLGQHVEAKAQALAVWQVLDSNARPVPSNVLIENARLLADIYTALEEPALAAEYAEKVRVLQASNKS